jgi:hypothetical protein
VILEPLPVSMAEHRHYYNEARRDNEIVPFILPDNNQWLYTVQASGLL